MAVVGIQGFIIAAVTQYVLSSVLRDHLDVWEPCAPISHHSPLCSTPAPGNQASAMSESGFVSHTPLLCTLGRKPNGGDAWLSMGQRSVLGNRVLSSKPSSVPSVCSFTHTRQARGSDYFFFPHLSNKPVSVRSKCL